MAVGTTTGREGTVRAVNTVSRTLGFAWLGVLAFVIYPPSGLAAALVQAVGYAVAALTLVAWTLLDFSPRAARHRTRILPVLCGVIAAAAGAAAGAGNGGLALLIFALVAALVAAGAASLAAGITVTAAGILAFEVSGLVFGLSYALLGGLAAVVVSGLLLGRNWSVYRVQAEQAAALLAQRERLEAEQRRADLLDERTRIAREIHDVLAHSLGALGIQIQAARSVLTDRGDIGRADELLAAAQRQAAEGLVETRRAVQALRSDTLPLNAELVKVTETYARRYGVPISFDTDGTPQPLAADATIALLRVAQEALVNAAKHAAGQHVAVRLDWADSDVTLVVRNTLASDAVSDHGPSVCTADAGYGLTGMRERLRLLNGTLEAGRHDESWVVIARLPVSQPETMAS
jgi:signal transduction histidine kinase